MGKGKYLYTYLLTDTELIILRNTAELAGLNHEMTVDHKIGSHIDLNSVTKLTLVRQRNEIRVRGPLTLTTVYAYDEDLPGVWADLSRICMNAQQIEK